MAADHYVCLHGHFYQPPRENPWLEAVEQQEDAHPYHDWNERITAECYGPNSAARILNAAGEIAHIINNYAAMSFNFGPTLLTWLQQNAPKVYQAVLAADRESRQRFGGHGSALAQAYSHMILPLASAQDKKTQIKWGIADFVHRFQRQPEGMWLPETAADTETLEILAEEGIQFTILAPRQASRCRELPAGEWQELEPERIDPRRPYLVVLPSGRQVAVFFYHGPLSRQVAFEGLLESGEKFAASLLGAFAADTEGPQLVHIATDGETYGHHHHFGDMALAYVLHHLQGQQGVRLTNYAQFLARHPPRHQVAIVERSSWSCVHGIERWRTDCGCNTGAHPKWNQAWRRPLRQSLEWLQAELARRFEEVGAIHLRDPWEARNDYIRVVLQRTPEVFEDFVDLHRTGSGDAVTIARLMEMQRHAMLMFTSCGWFFDDLGGVETVQILQYASRALQLARELFGIDLEDGFLARLQEARSNRSEIGSGKDLYESKVKPLITDLKRVAANYGMASLVVDDGGKAPESIYCYRVRRHRSRRLQTGRTTLQTATLEVVSELTWEREKFSLAALHLGNHNVVCGVDVCRPPGPDPDSILAEIESLFGGGDLVGAVRALDRYFEDSTFDLTAMFKDDQMRLLQHLLQATLAEAEALYRRLYEDHGPLLAFLKKTAGPPPRLLALGAELVLNGDLKRALEAEEPSWERIEALLAEAKARDLHLEVPTLEYAYRMKLQRLATAVAANPEDIRPLELLVGAVALGKRLPFAVNLWEVQNLCYELIQAHGGRHLHLAAAGDSRARRWLELVRALASQTNVSASSL